MLNIFTLANGRLFQEEIESLEELTRFKPIWVDLEDPTPEEKRWIKQHYGLSIPDDAMDEDIEESARFYEEDNGEMHIRSDFLIDDDEEPRTVRVAFILNQHNADLKSRGVLFSIHEEDLPLVMERLRLHLQGKAPIFTSEHRMDMQGNGTWVWVRARGRVVERDADGQPVRIAGTARDITASRNAEYEHRIAGEVMRSSWLN